MYSFTSSGHFLQMSFWLNWTFYYSKPNCLCQSFCCFSFFTHVRSSISFQHTLSLNFTISYFLCLSDHFIAKAPANLCHIWRSQSKMCVCVCVYVCVKMCPKAHTLVGNYRPEIIRATSRLTDWDGRYCWPLGHRLTWTYRFLKRSLCMLPVQ